MNMIFFFFFFYLKAIFRYQKETEDSGWEENSKNTTLVAGKESQKRSVSIVLASPLLPDRQSKLHHCQLCVRQCEEPAAWIFGNLAVLLSMFSLYLELKYSSCSISPDDPSTAEKRDQGKKRRPAS